MGMHYIAPENIQASKTEITEALSQHSNYFVRANIVQRFIEQHIPKDARIIELGAGAGELASWLYQNDYRNLHLIDIDDYLLHRSLHNHVNFSLIDICNQEFPAQNESVDAVLATAIWEHLENPFFALREVVRVLRKDGLFLCSIPHIFQLRSRLSYALKGDVKGYNEHNNHISLFTRSLFRKVFLAHFMIEKVYFGRGYIKIFGKKIKFSEDNQFLGKYFGDKALYVFRKK